MNPDDFYNLRVQLESRLDASRKIRNVEVYNIFDVLAEEIASLENATETLRKTIAENQLPPVYFSHPVVVNAPAGTPVHPIAIYFDGVAFTRTDTVVSFYVYLLLTGRRHHVCNLRKSELCKCGCKGWCSYFLCGNGLLGTLTLWQKAVAQPTATTIDLRSLFVWNASWASEGLCCF